MLLLLLMDGVLFHPEQSQHLLPSQAVIKAGTWDLTVGGSASVHGKNFICFSVGKIILGHLVFVAIE